MTAYFVRRRRGSPWHLPRYVVSPCQYTVRAWENGSIHRWRWEEATLAPGELCSACERSLRFHLKYRLRVALAAGISELGEI